MALIPNDNVSVNSSVIPAVLKEIPNWVTWKLVDKGDGVTKIPFVAGTDKWASSMDASTWRTFNQVESTTLTTATGIGFVIGGLAIEKRLVGVDLDGCRNPATGDVTEWATRIINSLDSYTEITPSKTGLRVWVIGDWLGEYGNVFDLNTDAGFGSKVKIEVYNTGRYFTVTGDTYYVEEEAGDINARDLTHLHELVNTIKKEYPAKKDTVERSGGPTLAPVAVLHSGTVITDKYELLMRGKIVSKKPFIVQDDAGNSLEYPSQSEADMALCNLSALKHAGKPDVVNLIWDDFAASTLFRPKWGLREKWFKENTITKAIKSASKLEKITPETVEQVKDSVTSLPSRASACASGEEVDRPDPFILDSSALASSRLGDIYSNLFLPNGFPLEMAIPALVTAASVRVPVYSGAFTEGKGLIVGDDDQMVNLYTAIIGPVNCGKTQVIQWACRALEIYRPDEAPRYMETKYPSTETMLRYLEKNIKNFKENFLIHPDEWAYLFQKNRVMGSSFATFMTTSYYRRKQKFPLAGSNKVVLIDNGISYIGSIVDDQFDIVFDADSLGGLYDRFLFGMKDGWKFDYRPYPGQRVCTDDGWNCVPVQQDGSVFEVVQKWNKEHADWGRVVELMVRIATIYASLDGRKIITGADIERLEGLARYQMAIREKFSPNVGILPEAKFQHAVLNWLRSHGTRGQWATISEVKNGVHAYEMSLGPTVALRTLGAMGHSHQVEIWMPKLVTKADGGVEENSLPEGWTGRRPKLGLIRLAKVE